MRILLMLLVLANVVLADNQLYVVAQSAQPGIHATRSQNETTKSVLWDNSDVGTNYVQFGSWEANLMPADKNKWHLADDFLIPENTQWRIKSMCIYVYEEYEKRRHADSIAVYIFANDDTTDKPGELVHADRIKGIDEYKGACYLDFTEPFTLPPGRYWFSAIGVFPAFSSGPISWYWGTGPTQIELLPVFRDLSGLTRFGRDWITIDKVEFNIPSRAFSFALYGTRLPEPGALYPDYTVDVSSGYAPLTVQFKHNTKSHPDNPVATWQWDFDGDGQIDAQDENPSFTFSNPGVYDVSLTVSNDSAQSSKIKSECIRVMQDNSSLYFNGSTGIEMNRARTRVTPALDVQETFTFEAWIKPTGWGPAVMHPTEYFGAGTILCSDTYDIRVMHDKTVNTYFQKTLALRFRDFTTGTFKYFVAMPDYSIKLDEWQHIAVACDLPNKIVNLYLNGEKQKKTIIGGAIPSKMKSILEQDIVIGNTFLYRTFDGHIDEFRIWNTRRTDEDILNNMNAKLTGTEEGLVAYWQLDEATGDIAYDKSGNGHDLTIDNPMWYQGVFQNETAVSDFQSTPNEFALKQNYANPFNPATTVSFTLQKATRVTIDIYNINGQHVQTLLDDHKNGGVHNIEWNARSLPSGTYFIRMRADDFIATRKSLLLR